MRVTTRTNLAVRILMYCGANQGRLVTREEIADTVNASAHHIGHVVGRLSHMGLLNTVRGRAGGLELARPMDEINIGHLFRDIEGDVPLAECFDAESNTCPLHAVCLLRKALERAAAAFYATLDEVVLRDLVEDNTGLEALMCQGNTLRRADCAMARA
ncbi:MAG: Rrf2 family transcriptional regulator [Rhodobacterales bacterium]|nr:MAG: Rrf2 family transcriptional regulator [Rhodobacterales bacterium]